MAWAKKQKADRKPIVPEEMSAEQRAAHIAEHIGICAQEMGKRPTDLTWADFREYACVAWGENRIGILRRDITRLGGFNALRDSYHPKDPTDQAVTKSRLLQHAAVNRKLGKELADASFVLKEIERLATTVFRGRVTPAPSVLHRTHRPKMIDRAITLMLSDLHIGSDLKKEETGYMSFGRVEEARRLAQIVKQVIEYKIEHRQQTELHITINGDLLHGKLHDQIDGAILSEQIIRAIHLLTQVVAQLAPHFRKVVVHCTSGNHDRILTRHEQRATTGKADSYASVIYAAVANACKHLKNVTWQIPTLPYAAYEVLGHRFFLTHGDTVLKPGNPGKSINTKGLEEQVNKINATLRDAEEYAAFLMGHVHVPMQTQLSNGAHVVTNGPLVPVDGYCVSLGILEGVCAQVMFETVPDHAVGDLRIIRLNSKVDKDSSLDSIIQPWQGLEQYGAA